MTPKFKNVEGFTLVELLVSLALLSLMTIYGLNALSSLNDINRAVGQTEAQMEIDAVARHLRDAIADIRPVFTTDESNAQQLLFKGSSDSLEFVGAANGEREAGGLYLLRYSVNAGHELIVERAMWRERQELTFKKVILMRGIKSIAFKYAASQENAGGEEITDLWRQTDVLPGSIEVNVEFEGNGERKWPTVLASLKNGK